VFAVAWLAIYSGSEKPLYALSEFLFRASQALGEFVPFGYAVRRLVFPVLLDKLATNDPSRFNDAKHCLSTLWQGLRAHLKAEMAVAFSAMIIPALGEKVRLRTVGGGRAVCVGQGG
jgi:hypothetical protein